MSNYIKIGDTDIQLIDGDRGDNYPSQNEFYDKEYCLFLDASNVMDNGFDLNNIHFITKEKDNRLRSGKLQRNDIIMTTRGSVGNVALYDDTIHYDNVRINSGMIILRCNSDYYPPFLVNLLRSPFMKKQIENIMSGSVQKQLPASIIKTLKIIDIEFDEQKRIADILDRVNKKIKNNKKINKELESMAKTIYDYWFLQFEFPNKEGKPYKSSGGKMVWNEELKKEIPQGWETHNLKNILSKNNSTKKLKTNEYLTKGKIPIIDQSSEFICGFTNNEEIALHFNDAIVFGDHTQTVKYINFEFARGADGTQIINSKNERLSNYLLYQQIKSMNLVTQGYSRYFKFLKEKSIIIPSKDVNDRYFKITKNLNDKIKNNLFENLELESLRDFLLPLLMNGQVGFRELALAED